MKTIELMERKAFLDQEPPPGYVAGIGRGATGFTTSADSGPVRFQPNLDDEDENGDNEDELKFQDDDEGGILGLELKDKDDDEADRIYEEIDRKMNLRNKNKSTGDLELSTSETSDKIKGQFTDLKRALTSVNDNEWANIPEVGDITRRNKRTRLLEQQQQRTYAMPDSVIAGAGSMGSLNSNDEVTNFQSISQAKDLLLSKQLDQIAGTSDNNNENIAKELEELQNNDSKIQDIKKGRLVLASLRKTEPRKSNSWIASARLEEQANNYTAAKKFIIEGCHNVPHNPDIWLENIRIHQKTAEGTKFCKAIVNEGLKFNIKSEKLWLKAFELENKTDIVSRRKILMKGLEFIPTNVELWKSLVNLEDSKEDVQKLLTKAVELCPKEWDFWLTLINLSNYDDAKSLLNKARKALTDNYMVWIIACKLEEREKDDIPIEKLNKLLAKGFKELEKNTVDKSHLLSKAGWLNQAIDANLEGFTKTSSAIVKVTLDSDGKESLDEWLDDAEKLILKREFRVAHFIYEYIIDKFPNNIESWLSLILSMKNSQDFDESKLFEYYSKAVNLNQDNELLLLMYAKDKWLLGNDVEGARMILSDASSKLPTSENIWLARIKLEVKNHNYQEAMSISTDSIDKIPTSSARVWFKHIHLMRFLARKKIVTLEVSDFLSLTTQALDLFPEEPKLYLQKSLVLVDFDLVKQAREVLSTGTKKCPNSIEIWINLAWVDEKYFKTVIRARSVLDTAILKNPTSDKLWEAKIKLERRQNDRTAAQQITNKALKIFPSSSSIWIQHLSLIPKMSQRKNAFLDAMRNTNNSTSILLSIGVFFWLDGKFLKAKSWFERALTSNKQSGESWGWLYCFIDKYGSAQEKLGLLRNLKKNYDDINDGETWNHVNKDLDNFEKTPKEIIELVSAKLLAKSI